MKCNKCKDGYLYKVEVYEKCGTVEGFAGFRCTECGRVGMTLPPLEIDG